MAAAWLEKLVDDDIISRDQLADAEAFAGKKGIKVETALVELGYADEEDLASEGAQPVVGEDGLDVAALAINDEVLALIPQAIAEEKNIIPVQFNGEAVEVATTNPNNFDLLEELRFLLNREVILVAASAESIKAALADAYGAGGETSSVNSMLGEFTETAIDFSDDDLANVVASTEDSSAPVIRLVNMIITEAVNLRASDIHIEPFEDRVRIRYRIDGVLVERDSPPRRLLGALVSRVKIMGKIDITEKRRPQDGRIKTRIGPKDYDLRVSILPTNHGQAIVLRILDRESINVGLQNLGFAGDNYRMFQNIIRRPNGIFLVTGPTGSGKTTTLYSALSELNRPDKKIITAEDPVEYMLPGINQVEVRASIGLTFASIIRAMLRQAPNVILVGEIRDTETGEMAIQASLTGHLVFSTLHTNDAPASITRLVDMGIQPFLVASTVMAILAQRLVRRVCSKCATPYVPDSGELQQFEITPEMAAKAKFQRGRGCKHCHQSGFHGRCAVFELMAMNSTLREMTFRGEPTQTLRRQARLLGMKTLVDDATIRAIEGVTSLSEAYKLTKGGH